MVECTALEMRHTRKGIGGSNPSLSAITFCQVVEIARVIAAFLSVSQLLSQLVSSKVMESAGAGVIGTKALALC